MTTQTWKSRRRSIAVIGGMVVLGLLLLGSGALREGEGLVRLTIASDSNRKSYRPSLSADGRLVAFHSESDFLNEGIADEEWHIWLADTETGEFTRVTGPVGTDRRSNWARLSADGTTLAFTSDGDFLGTGVSKEDREIWLYEIASRSFTQVTQASHTYRKSDNAAVSADGTVIAFQSDSDFHDEGIAGHRVEIWL